MDRLPIPVFLSFTCGSAGKESACNAGDLGLIPGFGRSHGEGKGYPLQYSGLENAMDCIVHEVAKSQAWLSDFHFHFRFYSAIMTKLPSFIWQFSLKVENKYSFYIILTLCTVPHAYCSSLFQLDFYSTTQESMLKWILHHETPVGGQICHLF